MREDSYTMGAQPREIETIPSGKTIEIRPGCFLLPHEHYLLSSSYPTGYLRLRVDSPRVDHGDERCNAILSPLHID